jgi:hypothetical protein
LSPVNNIEVPQELIGKLKKKGIRRINLTVLFDQVTVKPCCPRGRGPAAPVRTCMRENNSDGLPFPSRAGGAAPTTELPHAHVSPFPNGENAAPSPHVRADQATGIPVSWDRRRKSGGPRSARCLLVRLCGAAAAALISLPFSALPGPFFLATVVMGRRFVYYAQHVVRPSRITKPRPLCLEERGAKECVQSV